jgi:hypothetical protein
MGDMPDQLKDLEMACNIVKQGKNDKEKLNALNVLIGGDVDMQAAGAVELLNRRALLITMLREKEIWGHPV